MAGNKFATMLHRNSHKITLILVYAVLEWTLIYLLLLNSLFSYLIMKFANYFGLKPPCLLCSRIDHLLDSKFSKNSYSDLVCEHHASEISKLGYCSNHQKLAESNHMCDDCSSSRPGSNEKSTDFGGKIGLISWVRNMGLMGNDSEKNIETEENNFNCSCCDVSLITDDLYSSSYLFLKPSWGVLDYTQKENLVKELVPVDHDNDEGESSDPSKSDCQPDRFDEEHRILSVESTRTEEETIEERESNMVVEGLNVLSQSLPDFLMTQLEDESIEMVPMSLENCFDLDSTTLKNQDLLNLIEIEEVKEGNLGGFLSNESKIEKQDEDIDMGVVLEENNPELVLADKKDDIMICEKVESIDMGKDEISSSSPVKDDEEFGLAPEESDLVVVTQEPKPLSNDDGEVLVVAESDSYEHPEYKEKDVEMSVEEPKSENLIMKEFSDQESNYHTQVEEQNSSSNMDMLVAKNDQSDELSENKEEFLEKSVDEIGSENLIEKEIPDNHSQAEEQVPQSPCAHPNAVESAQIGDVIDQGSEQAEEENYVEDRTISDEGVEERRMDKLSISLDFNRVEDEKSPRTPTYLEALQHIHKKILLEKKESGSEELPNGSLVSETENGDGNLTIEKLKSALKAEHKALSVLYAELEEERSASAIAANQTMAMINRLQEEKSTMEMESLQYQRMMEEQSEYDQEALQLLNELMIKREKEKQELEKELEVYRKKVLHYEAKEKRAAVKRKSSNSTNGRSGTSSSSSGNATDNEELSTDLNHENADEYSLYGNQESINHNTPGNGVLNLDELMLESSKNLSALDESLFEFEEERQSILEQLKALEEKLFTLGENEDGEEDQLFEDIKPIKDILEENEKESNEIYEFKNHESKIDTINGLIDDLDKKHAKAKKLLPLFDAIDMESEYDLINEELEGSNASISKFSPDEKKLAIVEEVDHVYERLHALEADREFLKHCISSLNKGDKGINLLQEILQHLRDLRSIELRARNSNESSLQ